jgi:hypothetical protein
LCCEVWGLSNDLSFSAIIGRKRRTPPVFLRSQGPVTRSITQARNNLVSEPTMSSSSSSPADERLECLETIVANISSKFDQLLEDHRTNSENGSYNRNGGPRINRTGSGSKGSTVPKVTKLDFPRYCGDEDPTSWICRVEQFFEFHDTNEEEKLSLAAYHLDSDAQLWYQIFRGGRTEELTWDTLKEGLNARYGPTLYEDFFGDLSKLKQIRSVRDYQVQFERLLSRVGKLSLEHQLGCFISGLKDTIRIEVQASRPKSLIAAVGLARLYEAKQHDQRRGPLSETQKNPNLPPMPSSTLIRAKNPQIKKLTL